MSKYINPILGIGSNDKNPFPIADNGHKILTSISFDDFMNNPDIVIKKPVYMLKWPVNIPMFIRQQLTDIFSQHNYSVSAEIEPLHMCKCSQNCPAIVVNITECSNFGRIPVALCRFSYSWHHNEQEKVDDILRQCGCLPNPYIDNHFRIR